MLHSLALLSQPDLKARGLTNGNLLAGRLTSHVTVSTHVSTIHGVLAQIAIYIRYDAKRKLLKQAHTEVSANVAYNIIKQYQNLGE